MTPPLFSLCYFSRNLMAGSAEDVRTELDDILRSSQRNNRARHVTGVLLHSDGCFAQVLEGAHEDVEVAYEVISRDPRHDEVTILHMYPIEARSFATWSMAFVGVDGIAVDPDRIIEAVTSPRRFDEEVAARDLVATLHELLQRHAAATADAQGVTPASPAD